MIVVVSAHYSHSSSSSINISFSSILLWFLWQTDKNCSCSTAHQESLIHIFFSLITCFATRCHTVIIPYLLKGAQLKGPLYNVHMHSVEHSLNNFQYDISFSFFVWHSFFFLFSFFDVFVVAVSVAFPFHSILRHCCVHRKLNTCVNVIVILFSSKICVSRMASKSIACVNRANLTSSRREKVSCRSIQINWQFYMLFGDPLLCSYYKYIIIIWHRIAMIIIGDRERKKNPGN